MKFNKVIFLKMGICAFLMIIAWGAFSSYCNSQIEEDVRAEWKYYNIPLLSSREMRALAYQAKQNPQQYVKKTNKRAEELSGKLLSHIRLWLKGKGPAEFPKGFFSEWIDNEKTHSWRLVKYEDIDFNDQWIILPEYDPAEQLHQFSPDPHVTYLKLIFLAPLNSKLVIEGDFPHARFMNYQITGPFDPLHPQGGTCEVPIVDVDIEPDPGHVNPFRVGAVRDAKNRRYHLEFELKAGNALMLNPQAMLPPEYRSSGNIRIGGPFQLNTFYEGNVIVPAILWVRYYAPDKGAGPLGGVPLPKAHLELPSGEKFWITADKSKAVELITSPVRRIKQTEPMDPYPFIGPSLGWFKMYDIMFAHMEARGYHQSKPWGKDDPVFRKNHTRREFSLLCNRGSDEAPPGNYETGPTCCNYLSYLVRPISLGGNKVIVLTGRLPSFSKTRQGEKIMTKADVRYFSITHQLGTSNPYNRGYHGTPYGSLMDDEIITDQQGDYIIVYSRASERPANARPEYGVTWQEWGEPALQGLVLRWMSIMPDWYLSKYAPDQNNVPWKRGAWSEENYDKDLVGNNYPGVMGAYHPVIHYMAKDEFEALGSKPLKAQDMPKWISDVPMKEIISGKTESKSAAIDIQQKLKDLQKALADLRQARESKNRRSIIKSARNVKAMWDNLSLNVQQAIEEKSPGITEKIANISY